MNTRGLTELVILTVGLNLGILSQSLYSLMVVMAIVTTGMAGPLLRYIYPNRIMERDITEADRSALGRAGAHRVVVLVDDPQTAVPLVDVAARLASTKTNTDVVLVHLVAHSQTERLDLGSGLGGELLAMTQTMDVLQQLAARAEQRGVTTVVQSRFSDDVAAELPAYIAATDPDTIVLHKNAAPVSELTQDGKAQLVIVLQPLPQAPSAATAQLTRGADADAAVQVAAHFAAADGLPLVITPQGRASSARISDLARRGVQATAGDAPPGSLLVVPGDLVLTASVAATASLETGNAAGSNWAKDGTAADGGALLSSDAHIAVISGTNEASDDMDQWVEALDRPQRGTDLSSEKAGSSDQ